MGPTDSGHSALEPPDAQATGATVPPPSLGAALVELCAAVGQVIIGLLNVLVFVFWKLVVGAAVVGVYIVYGLIYLLVVSFASAIDTLGNILRNISVGVIFFGGGDDD